MKTTILPLAALLGLTLATQSPALTKRAKAICDTDAEEAPADNDCLAILSTWTHENDETGPLDGGAWAPITCSETCKISVQPEEDGFILKGQDLYDQVQIVLNKCGLDENYDSKSFKGEASDKGFRTSVYKGGDC